MRPKSQKEETKIYRILKFCIYQAYIEQNTAIPKLQTLLRNA